MVKEGNIYEKIISILQGIDQIKTIYIWMPNKDGRAIIDVKNNDINTTLKNFFDSLDIENSTNPEYKRDMENLIKNFGIFAVEVQEKYSIRRYKCSEWCKCRFN